MAFGQTNGLYYSQNASLSAYTANGAATTIHAANTANAVAGPIPITFKFNYGGQPVTQMWVSSNGWISFQDPGGNSYPTNNLATTSIPIVAPLWDSLKCSGTGNVSVKTVGLNPNKTLRVEWFNMLWSNGASTYAIDFQVWLYQDSAGTTAGNGSRIDFRYRRNTTGGAGNLYLVSPSASIGFTGFCPGDFYADSISGSLPTTLFKKDQDLAVIGFKPNNTQLFSFAPLPHPNDWASTAQAISLQPSQPLQQYDGTTLQSTWSNTVPLPACWNAADTFDVWFAVTKPTGITNFELFADRQDCRGATYKVKMAVYTDTTAAPIACDATNAGAVAGAMCSWNFTGQPCAQTTYYVRIGSAQRSYFRFNVRPPGRNCAYANDITGCWSGGYSSPLNLSTCGFGNDYDSLYAACHSRVQHGDDYVFSFTPPSNLCVNFSLANTASNSNPGLFIYASGCPSPYAGPSGSEVCYGNVSSAGGSTLLFNNVTLTAGQTYYFVVDYDSSGGTPCLDNFNLIITDLGPPNNAIDYCSVAQGLNVIISSSCVGVTDYQTNCATPSAAGTVPTPGCGSFTDGITPDVWFTFTSGAVITTPYQINVDLGIAPAAQDLAMAIYSGSCAGLTLVGCDDNSNGLMPAISFLPNPSTNYYVRIWSNNGTKPGNFRICVLSGCTPPNDLCTGSITLQNGQPLMGDNGCSTGTGEPSAGTSAGCWVNTGGAAQLHTVWYNFVATNSQMRIRLRLLTMYDSQMALYSSSTGNCAGTFTEIFCNNNGPNNCGSGGTIRWSEITATGLTVGNTYFLRVDGVNAGIGTFELTLVEGTTAWPPINTQDCALAQGICTGNSMTVADPGFQGTGNICDMANGGSTCMAAGERGSAWYTWTVTGTGAGTPMNFIIQPNSPTDYDFVLYVIDTVNAATGGDGIPAVPNYCSQLTNASAFPAMTCNWSACGNTGANSSAGTIPIPGGYFNGGAGAPCNVPAIMVPAGMTATFLLQVSNYTTSTAGFTLNFLGTPVNSTPPSMIWTGNANTTTWGTITNWTPNNCSLLPDCANQIPAFIGTGAYQPTLVAVSTTVKDITINPGANLTIAPNCTLQVCGNFTNNGNITCGVGSVVQFISNANQSINGNFGAASNQFYHLTFLKSGGTVTFNTDIYCQGNFTITGPNGVVNLNNKTLEVGGNFYNYNGNTSLTGVGAGVGGSTITFTKRSNVNQLFQNDGSALTLNNVNIRQQLAGGTITLNTNATSDLIIGTSGILSLGSGAGVGQHGVIITPAGTAREVNVLNSASAGCNAGSASSYVRGKLRRAIATAANSYDFPVGDATKGYELANITYTTAPTGTYNLLAQFKTWGGANCAFPGLGPVASECLLATYDALPYFDHGYWNIDASTGAPTGTYQATLYNNSMTNNTGMGWTVVKATSGTCSFSLNGNCFIGSTATQTRRDNLTGFSDFATVQSQNPLPIELLSFNAKANDEGVLCSWATASETNNDHFDIERSKDGKSFSKIGEMEGFGAGTSVNTMEYNFQDDQICTGTFYYRLKQVDLDGKFSYSDIVAVNCKNSAINISPNPANNRLDINFFEQNAGEVTVEIVDIIGKHTMVNTYVAEKGYNNLTLDITPLASGVYYLKIISNNQGETFDALKKLKFLKY